MSDPEDENIEALDRINEQPPRFHKKKRPGGFLNLLSSIFVAGTLVVGLLFAIIFINPHSSLNPLPPIKLPTLILTYNSSSTPKSVLPPTWTPMIPPTDTSTATPMILPTDTLTATPIPTDENSQTPRSDPLSDGTFSKQESSLTPEVVTVQAEAGCSRLGIGGGVNDIHSIPVNTQLSPQLSQARAASALSEPIPTEQFLTNALQSDDGIADLFTPEIKYWEEEILAWGEEYGLDPNLIATVMQIESCGYVKAKSAAGAMGLFQVMPHHFKENEDPYDPDTNAFRGLSWLQKTLKSGGSTEMALAGYNAGIARIRNPNLEWPKETQRYVYWGLSIYQDSKCGYDYSSALDNWLSKGGSSLCNRAALEQQDKEKP